LTPTLATALTLAMVSTLPSLPVVEGGAGEAISSGTDWAVPTVGATVDRVDAHLGDRVTLTITAVAQSGTTVTLPQALDLGEFEVLSRRDEDPDGRDLGGGRRSHRFLLEIAVYEVGPIELPSVELSYRTPGGETSTVRTSPIKMNVRSLIGDSSNANLQPLRPPHSAMVEDLRVGRLARWILLSAVSLGGVWIAYFLTFRRRRDVVNRFSSSKPVQPPEVVAMARLGALRGAGNFSFDLYRPLFFAVAEAVRAYLGARYQFDSLELTTTELLEELGKRAPHLTGSQSQVVQFFEKADLVKFAKTGSTDETALRMIETAESIVLSLISQGTKPVSAETSNG
jgi:hypothetical protein